MQEDFRLLLLADTTLDRKQLERLLSKYAPHICLYEQSFFEKNSDVSFHGALVDYTFSTASGLPLWQHFQERHPYIPLILLTDETLWPQQAIDAGIIDFVPKSAVCNPHAASEASATATPYTTPAGANAPQRSATAFADGTDHRRHSPQRSSRLLRRSQFSHVRHAGL